MDIDAIKSKVRQNQYLYSVHAETEREAERLRLDQVEEAILSSQVLEQYPDTGRGVSCLLVGFAQEIPIHIVCGWRRGRVALITVYVPRPPHFIDPYTRGVQEDG